MKTTRITGKRRDESFTPTDSQHPNRLLRSASDAGEALAIMRQACDYEMADFQRMRDERIETGVTEDSYLLDGLNRVLRDLKTLQTAALISESIWRYTKTQTYATRNYSANGVNIVSAALLQAIANAMNKITGQVSSPYDYTALADDLSLIAEAMDIAAWENLAV